ncbi:thiamine phosphate synthase [Aeromicrobium sp. CF3.5]|uniref:thiamine phosphate synthase n=1 Tax=Aeromicrobium sp. CF3.5 TaxID=3373078 RepID=UPI003EE56564
MSDSTVASARQRLVQARLYLCTDASKGPAGLVALVRSAIAGGVDIVQVRDKSLAARDELALLDDVRDICDEAGTLFAVNDRADFATLTGAQILHTGQDDLPVADARTLVGPDVLLGRSSHSVEQAATAEADSDVDYFCVGPLWETPTKPGRAAVGLDTLRQVVSCDPVKPVFAIGGIDNARLGSVMDTGATRIVVVRAVTEADDPEAAARRLRSRLDASA